MPRSREQNRAIYERRVQRAREKGYSGYGSYRRVHHLELVKEREQEDRDRILEKLKDLIDGGVTIKTVEPLTPDRQKAYDRFVATGFFTETELQALLSAPDNEFWPMYQAMYERMMAVQEQENKPPGRKVRMRKTAGPNRRAGKVRKRKP